MKPRSISLVWGIVLILAGGLYLAQNLGNMENLPLNTWVIIFSVLSLLFFATFFIYGVEGWRPQLLPVQLRCWRPACLSGWA